MALVGAGSARAQFAAMMQMRWRMLANGLRKGRGRLEFGARAFWMALLLLVSLAIAAGMMDAAWIFTSNNQLGMLPLLLWPIFLIWQMMPIMLTSFQEHTDLSILLRFPVSFSTYSFLYLFFGLFDLSFLLGTLALLGMWIGIVLGHPSLALWAAIALALFAAFNLLLTRMIFAWLDRWLAQRKTREILGMLFLFLLLGLQVLNPALHRSGRVFGQRPTRLQRELALAAPVERLLPPGLAASSLELAGAAHSWPAAKAMFWLSIYGVGAGSLLALRLHAEYRGESLGEAPKRRSSGEIADIERHGSRSRGASAGWGPIGAILEKELHFLLRSGVMLYSMAAPLVLLFVIGRSPQGAGFFDRYALPIGAVFGFLGLTRQICNSFGGEGAGIQLYFLLPIGLRTVVLGKNLVQIGLFCLEAALAGAIIWFRFGFPAPALIAATLCWLLFALPLYLALGNILSITMAYRMTLTRLSRERGATGNGLLSLLIQVVIAAIGAAVFFSFSHFGRPALAAPALLVLAAGAFLLWIRVLANVDRMAANRREMLFAALVRET